MGLTINTIEKAGKSVERARARELDRRMADDPRAEKVELAREALQDAMREEENARRVWEGRRKEYLAKRFFREQKQDELDNLLTSDIPAEPDSPEVDDDN